jgi:two-component system alkaline phosphatase synthesis response regulator PhoP
MEKEKPKTKILLAEDDKFLSQVYKRGLEQAGFEVILALDGIEALKKIVPEKPDLVLLDVLLPVKNGFEVLEEIKKDKNLEHIPVIILSNLAQESDIQKGKVLGAKDYWVKANTSMKEVIRRTEKILSEEGKK